MSRTYRRLRPTLYDTRGRVILLVGPRSILPSGEEVEIITGNGTFKLDHGGLLNYLLDQWDVELRWSYGAVTLAKWLFRVAMWVVPIPAVALAFLWSGYGSRPSLDQAVFFVFSGLFLWWYYGSLMKATRRRSPRLNSKREESPTDRIRSMTSTSKAELISEILRSVEMQ